MPELPEVEIISRKLRPVIVNKTIIASDLRWRRTLAKPSPAEFARRIRGMQIKDVSRRGKFIYIQLSFFHSKTKRQVFGLLFHLRMSGDLFVNNGKFQPQKHDRLILTLSEGTSLIFNDPRKFGRVWLVCNTDEILLRLGPEPLDPTFTPQKLHHALHTHHRQIKPLLLDQTFLAGLGNIYTDEALHLAKIHPVQPSHSLTELQTEHLWRSIRKVLQESILRNGSSIDWVYRGGDFQNHFQVYARHGKPCNFCRTKIERSLVGQRGTHYCPNCQRLRI